MNDLKSFVERLGGLHDSTVHRIIWDKKAQTLHFEIDDLCSNFEGLPEYPGPVRGTIVLRGIDRVVFEIDTSEKRLKINDFLVSVSHSGENSAAVSFWRTGRITADYQDADFPEVKLHQKP